MSQANTVLIYSTLSENCRRFFNIISSVQNEFINLTGLRLLCIDSKKIRDIVTKSKNVIVDKVPTILVLRQDGGVEMYDGANAFKWTSDIINTYIQPPQPPPPQPLQPPQPPLQAQQAQPLSQQPHNTEFIQPSDLNLTSSQSDDTPVHEVPKRKRETSENLVHKVKRPPASVRTDAGNYDFSSEFDELEESERRAPTRNIKDNKSTKDKSGNIMAIAQALQKDRETDGVSIQRDS